MSFNENIERNSMTYEIGSIVVGFVLTIFINIILSRM
jgi:ABC-type polysaccharide transport system permease subunit